MDRNLDGVYFRVNRNGKWESVCFSDLTVDEMEIVLQGRSEEWLKSMCVMLGSRIREIGDELDIRCGGDE